MTSQNQHNSGSRRRGQSGRNRRPRGGHSSERQSGSPAPQRAPKPKSFLEKLFAFITGGSPKKAAPTSRAQLSSRPAITDEDREERQRGRSREPKRRERKPELVEVTSPKLYVGNLSFDATESDLSELFNGVGSVQTAEVVSHRDTQRSKGFGFVTMTSLEEAQRAVNELHDKDFMGRKLVVSGAKTSDVRSYTPSER